MSRFQPTEDYIQYRINHFKKIVPDLREKIARLRSSNAPDMQIDANVSYLETILNKSIPEFCKRYNVAPFPV